MACLADTHCHLNLNQFENDLDAVLQRAFAKGVGRILVPGIDVATSRRAVELSELHKNLFAAIGVHPNSANSWNSDTIKEITSLSRYPKVVAIGEIGLDYYRRHATPQAQQAVFQAQLELAAELKLPVVVHHRNSLQDAWPMLSAWQMQLSQESSPLADHPGVLHAFEGTTELAVEAAGRNFQFGVGGPITYPKVTDREQVVAGLPLQNILIETDSPYLPPQPFRGTRNEPAYVEHVAEKIAKIHQKDLLEVARTTTENAERLFLWRADH